MYIAFVDLSKALDRVPRALLWSIHSRFGCSDKIVTLVKKNFQDGMKVRVSETGALSDEFDVSMGVKKGCVMAPVLFNIFMLCVTHNLQRDAAGERVDTRYMLDRSIRPLKAKTQDENQFAKYQGTAICR